jgi:hypothetical protein
MARLEVAGVVGAAVCSGDDVVDDWWVVGVAVEWLAAESTG